MRPLLLLLLITACACTACTENKTARLDSGDPGKENVFDSINALIKESPGEPELYFERAKMHADARDIAASLNDIGRALKLDSSNTAYYIMLADLKIITRESREARDALLKAYLLDPTDVNVLLRLGELYMIVQDHEESFYYLNEVLKLDVYNATAYRLKGFNYKYLGDTVNAVSSFQTAVEQNPHDYDSYLQLALLYSEKKHPIALDYYNNALKVKPGSVEALYAKGLFLQTTGQSREAINTYRTILDITGEYFDAWYNIGYVYLVQLERYDSAAFSFTRAIEFGPEKYEEAYYNRGLSYEQAGDLKMAEADYRRALDINPQYDLAALGLSRLDNQP